MKRRAVEFRSENPQEMIRADLYTPDMGRGPWPVIVMGGGWCYACGAVGPEVPNRGESAIHPPG